MMQKKLRLDPQIEYGEDGSSNDEIRTMKAQLLQDGFTQTVDIGNEFMTDIVNHNSFIARPAKEIEVYHSDEKFKNTKG